MVTSSQSVVLSHYSSSISRQFILLSRLGSQIFPSAIHSSYTLPIDLTNSRMRDGTLEQRLRRISWLRCCALSVVSWRVANVVKLQRNTSLKSIYENKVEDTIMMDNPLLRVVMEMAIARRVMRGIDHKDSVNI